jgi:hypothetical protein
LESALSPASSTQAVRSAASEFPCDAIGASPKNRFWGTRLLCGEHRAGSVPAGTVPGSYGDLEGGPFDTGARLVIFATA